MIGAPRTAPCGHQGEVIFGNYVACPVCDKRVAAPTSAEESEISLPDVPAPSVPLGFPPPLSVAGFPKTVPPQTVALFWRRIPPYKRLHPAVYWEYYLKPQNDTPYMFVFSRTDVRTGGPFPTVKLATIPLAIFKKEP